MVDTEFPSAPDLLSQQRARRNLLTVAFTTLLLVVFGIMVGMAQFMPRATPVMIIGAAISIIVSSALPIWIWQEPRRGLMLLFAATTLLDTDPRALNGHKLTANFPFFLNFNNIGEIFHVPGLSPFKFSPAEMVIVLTALAWVVRGIAKRDLRMAGGPFLACLVCFNITTFIAFLRGYTSGGDLTMALWEVRAQAYPLLLYLMAINLLTERKHIEHMLWIAFIGLGLLGIVGLFSYIHLNGVVSDQGILDHEDSLILNVFVFLLLYLQMGGKNHAMVRVGYLFLPLVLFTILENNRRAGIAAFIIAFVASLPIMWVLFVERRRQIMGFIVAFAAISAVYLPAAWNSQGAWAMPARAIRSNSSPDTRDSGSDNYRLMEDGDLKYTRDTSPLLGYGYGKPFIQIYKLPHVTTSFLAYFAHDSVLWLWMSSGHVGFFVFLMFIATVLIRGLQICRGTRDPILLTAGVMGILFTLMAYIYGKYDLQLVNFRSMMMLGIWVGVLGALPRLSRAGNAAPEEARDDTRFTSIGLPDMAEEAAR